jgi:hypothetical protein
MKGQSVGVNMVEVPYIYIYKNRTMKYEKIFKKHRLWDYRNLGISFQLCHAMICLLWNWSCHCFEPQCTLYIKWV